MGVRDMYTTYAVYRGADGGVVTQVYRGKDYRKAQQIARVWSQRNDIKCVRVLRHDEREIQRFRRARVGRVGRGA